MKDKLVEGDVGLVEDMVFGLKNLIAVEDHALSSYGMSGEKKWIELVDIARKMRTKWISVLVKNEKSHLWCFVPNTKIITLGGLLDIENIKVGHHVLTHKNRFKKVTKIYKRFINEEIVKIKTNYTNINLEVTKNHLFYVADNLRTPQKDLWRKNYKKPSFVWKKAEDLKRNDFLYLPRYNLVKDIDVVNVSYKNRFKFSDSVSLKIDQDFMRLIGLYLSEGHHYEGIDKKRGWPLGYVGFSFSRLEEDLSEFIKKSFVKYFKCEKNPLYRKSTIEFSYGKRIIRKFFGQFGNKAHKKRIPSWVINLPNEKLKYLVKGLFEGDGSKQKFDFKYCTVSRELAYGLRVVLNKLGILCNITNRGKCKDSFIDGRRIKSNHEAYHLQIGGDSARKLADFIGETYHGGKRTSRNFGYVGNDYILIPVLKVENFNYFGNVYNLEVEDDESYSTFNGVAHNCISKHLLASSMSMQEIANRFASTNQLEQAKEATRDSQYLFSLFAILNNIGGENNVPPKSSA